MALDPKNTRYSLQNALALARASQLAYRDEATIKAGIADVIGDKLDDFLFLTDPVTNTQGYIASFDNSIVICFRGTEDLADWLQDGQIVLVPFRQIGLIHLGFRNALDSVYPAIEATLRKFAGKGRTLWVTGHSLGAALAMLSTAYLRFPADPTKILPRPVAGLYTFGQPRVGTVDFCQTCDGNFGSFNFRHVNNQDIVPRVPPRVLAYWHAGRIEYFDAKGVIHDDPAWWQIFLDEVEAGMTALRTLQQTHEIGPIGDHAIANYIAAIEKNLKAG
jgi:triacylglycerol lipase